MTRLPLTLSLLLPLVAGCELKGVTLTGGPPDEETSTSGGSGNSSVDPSATTAVDPTVDPTATNDTFEGTTSEPPVVPAVDILFVIDNSGSMARHQSLLASSMPALLSDLDGVDLRIAITTTDTGNPRCPSAQTTPEGGKFVLRSCIDAAANGDFAFNGQDFSTACTNKCSFAGQDFTITPTTTAVDPDPKPRAWIERTGGDRNISVDLVDALACALPQGVNGCGFESPLQAMAMALAQVNSPDSPTNYGFLRPEADLRIILVTDEADCSYDPEFDEIFTSNKAFWENPDRPDATSAVCFNAGVKCIGAGPTYTSCEAEDFASDGSPAANPEQAVLHPVSRYVQILQDIQASKIGDATVRLVAVTGVPVGFETGNVPLNYADDPDNAQQELFGIGPGCVSPTDETVVAIPPTRLLNVAEALGTPQFFSICEGSYDAAMLAAGAAP